MNFGDALHHIKNGYRVSRQGWNGKGMYLFLQPGFDIPVKRNSPLNQEHPEGAMVQVLPHIMMRTVDGTVVPWLCSQTDALATDWDVIDNGSAALSGRIGQRGPVLPEA